MAINIYNNTRHTIREKGYIEEIPYIRFYPNNNKTKYPTILFYHGWSSTKEKQELVAYTLATLGYQVIIPESIHHGERGKLDYGNLLVGVTHYWETVLSNLNEYEVVKNYSIERLRVDKDRIAVAGHSMGGFTSASIFATDKNVKTSIVLNGCCNWKGFNDHVIDVIGIEKNLEMYELENILDKYDPINKIDNIKNRPLLMTHGVVDEIVPIKPQIEFYKELKNKYSESEKLKFVKYQNLNHSITNKMIEEMIIWINSFL